MAGGSSLLGLLTAWLRSAACFSEITVICLQVVGESIISHLTGMIGQYLVGVVDLLELLVGQIVVLLRLV